MKHEAEAVFLFIAELTGSFEAGSGNKEDKIKCGIKDYLDSTLHDLDLATEEDRKDVHENVWLERLYRDLDMYFGIPEGNKLARCLSIDTDAYRTVTYKWSVPIELDASASLLQYMGILLNDKRLMEMTNVIGDTLEDPWKLEGLSRAMLKQAATPMLYGSSQLATDLWTEGKMTYTPEDVALYNSEMSSGPFGLVNLFKEFLINSCKPKPEMDIKIGDDEFTISCNRFRSVGEDMQAYKVWDSIDKVYSTILHTNTKKVPDIEQFRRYFVTLLIHNLDSQVANTVSEKLMAKYGWGIPIHDAILCSPAAAHDVRIWYAEELTKIHKNRKEILKDYFMSIGITNASAEQWEKVKDKTVQFEGEFECSGMALK